MARRSRFHDIMEGYKFGTSLGNTYVQAKAGEAYKDASQLQTRDDAYFGRVNPDDIYAGEGADGSMTNAEAASYGIMPPETQTRQYGLGMNPTWQDTAPTSQQKRMAGVRGIESYYSGRGQMDEAMKYGLQGDAMESNALQRQATGLQIDAARTANETRQRQLAADMNAENWQQFGAGATAARDSGQLRGLGQELRAKQASGEITPEQYAAAVGQLNTTYGREGAERGIGRAVGAGYGYKEGMMAQNAAHAQAKAALMEKAGAFASKGDWKGLADFFTNNDNYSDGRGYQFIGTTKAGKVTIASTDADGKIVGTTSLDPAELMAKVEAGLDPTKAGEFYKTQSANAKADRQFEITIKRMEQQHADSMARLGAYTKALGQKELKTTPELDVRIKAGYAELHTLQDPARAKEPGIKEKITAAEHRVRGAVEELAVMNKQFPKTGTGLGGKTSATEFRYQHPEAEIKFKEARAALLSELPDKPTDEQVASSLSKLRALHEGWGVPFELPGATPGGGLAKLTALEERLKNNRKGSVAGVIR